VCVSILLTGTVPCIVALPFATSAAFSLIIFLAHHRALARGRLRGDLPARHGAPGVVLRAWNGFAEHFDDRGIP
jgi:hypothetical protein